MLISAQFNKLIDVQDFYLPIFIRVKNIPRCQPEFQKSVDFRAAAFLGQNISAKVSKSQHFVLFEKKCVIFYFL